MARYTILITDKDLVEQGDPIASWTTLDVTLRFNEPGSGLFTVPAHPWILEQLGAGNRVIVNRHPDPIPGEIGAGEVLISGPIEGWLHERSDDGENAGVGMLRVDFADDLALVAAHVVYPNPALTPAAQDVDSWTYTGNAEVALRNLVNLNTGPGALAARRVPHLALGTLTGVGSSVTVTTQRMQPIGDVMRKIAEVGGGLGFKTRQTTAGQILFDVYDPPDVSNEVRFGFTLANLKYLATEVKAPTCTAAIVGGQGEGANRALIERVNTAEQATWGRYEKLVSRPGTASSDPDQPTLEDDGDKALADGAATVRVAANIVDTPNQRYGQNYGLGSKVAIESGPGQQLVDIVSTVHLQAWPTAGEVVAATVGSQAERTDPLWVQRLREIDERLGKIERTVVPAVA